MANEREIILEALLLCEKENEFADKVLSDILSKYAYLKKNERAFIDRVFTGVIERRLNLDYIINQFSSVKVNKQKPVIRTILRMGVYQILYMGSVPDSAAVNEAVKLAKKKKFASLSGFVNGVLRNISKNIAGVSYPDKEKDFAEYLLAKYSCPKWLCEHYINELGKEKAELLLRESLDKSPLYARVNLSKISRQELIKKLESEGINAEEVKELDVAVKLSNVDSLMQIESFREGLLTIQDLSSQLVIGQTEIKKGQLVVDVCSAPGGKSLHALDKGARVIARDISEWKIDRIRENIERCAFENAEVEVHDALVFDERLRQQADVVIADLPCSGLGVIGRKADIKYRVCEEDLESLSKLQRDILNVVYDYVKPGGILIYSTCTLDKKENEDNADWIVENLPFRKLSEYTKLVPGSDKTDGFFISRFIRE